ncbi:MAG: hypothetical protein V2J26_04340 [Pacificimonas sp.]|nr:hypothetical protein [Pacificimonas sp.]
MAWFDRFAAIDWSGAKGKRHKGIAIAWCERGNGPPMLIERGRSWSRTDVLNWIRQIATGTPRTLIAADFSFAPPFAERGAYLPGVDAPDTAADFWAFVDDHATDEDLGASSFLHAAFPDHFYFGAADGRKADYLFWRQCEHRFNEQGGGKSSTVYDAIGAGQVAKASFAGMRVLHHLNGAIPVWPFDFAENPAAAHDSSGSVLCEMYARAFIQLSGSRRGLKLRSAAALNAALAALGSKPVKGSNLDDHQTDVLVTAAGLRAIADDPRYWSPPGLTPKIARTEGWTFGVA